MPTLKGRGKIIRPSSIQAALMAEEEAADSTPQLRILSKRLVRPPPCEGGRDYPVIHLNPWDLKLISMDYIQKGILFSLHDGVDRERIFSSLLFSFSRTLEHFYPLAGRLATVKHETSDAPSLSIFVDCNDEGAEFIHASAPEVTVSYIRDSVYVPSAVLSFFPLNGLLSYDGHSSPLLAVQVTELADGFFVGCSMNHSVADGTSFWNFFNSWSEISRTGSTEIADPPAFERFFLDSCPAPIRLPFRGEAELIRRFTPDKITECAFHFSAESVAKLKAKANLEMGTERISSLQSLLAHLWRSVTRARGIEPQQETTYKFLVGCRGRLDPPLAKTYFGNSIYIAGTKAKAGELLERGLGWSAWLLNQEIASFTDTVVKDMLEEWTKEPSLLYAGNLKPWDLITGSSPRFDVYGNDFGWGKPVAVRSGRGNKADGKATIYPGPEKGSMALEVNLSAEVLRTLLEDKEFMEVVSIP